MSLSDYDNCQIMLTTKHSKATAIAHPFLDILGANIIEYNVDTDTLGTFTGEVERIGNALDCARNKCEWAFDSTISTEFALASEGSFGPHPMTPFIPSDQEILYFIDRKRGFQLSMHHVTENTNYRTGTIDSLDALYHFAHQIHFPSHALVIRPYNGTKNTPIYKGINTHQALEEAFEVCTQYTDDKTLWVETDMRAHMNPTRMHVIGELARKFAYRLKTRCQNCNNPGWGLIGHQKGLICSGCQLETLLVKSEVFGCVKCDYQEVRGRSDGKNEADPQYCQHCNP